MIAKLQYISAATETHSHLQNIRAVCEAGVKWVQLRMKEEPKSVILATAEEVRSICDEFGATFILNDYPEIARKAKADGIHLGKSDMLHKEARSLLGTDFVIGGTANTMEDIRQYATENVVDYVGLGPYRYTTTKKNLSPILGIEGYQKILSRCKVEKINLPIIAIGGIQINDLVDIEPTDIYGIAVSSLLNTAKSRKKILEKIFPYFQ